MSKKTKIKNPLTVIFRISESEKKYFVRCDGLKIVESDDILNAFMCETESAKNIANLLNLIPIGKNEKITWKSN